MLSFIFSMVVIGWAFSIARSDANQSQVSSSAVKQSLAQLELPNEYVIRGDSPEEIRDAMLAADQAFMRKLAKKRAAAQRDVPGIEQARRKWKQRTERAQREARQFENAEKGSIEWAYRQELIESSKDGPL